MQEIRYKVVLDVLRNGSQQKIRGFYCGESGARKIEIILIKDSDVLYIDDENTIIVYGEKPDGSTFMQSCEAENGKIIFTPLSSIFSVSGDVQCQIQVLSPDGNILFSPSFTVEVCDNIRDEDAIESSDEFQYLDEAIKKIEEIKGITGIEVPAVGSAFDFKGKTLLVTGDSITEKNFRATKNWHDFLKEWGDFAAVKNDGVSGSGLVKNNGIVYRIDNWDEKYGDFDIILIMGNMNDGTSGNTGTAEWYGKFEDQSDVDKETSLYGVLHYTMKTLIAKYPDKPIGWIISTPRSQVGDQGKCWGIDGWFERWVTAIKEVCGHYSIPVLDLYHESGLRPWNDDNNREYFSCVSTPNGDGIHPNAKGQELMAKKIYPWIIQHMCPNRSETETDTDTDTNIPVTGITLNKTTLSLTQGESATLTAIVTPSNATNKTVTWSVNGSCATVVNGTVTAISEGSCTITATTANGKTATCSVKVEKAETEIPITGITVSPATLNLTQGESATLSVTFTPSNATDKTVRWSVNGGCATVANGTVTAISEGNCTVTATTANGKTATCSVKVEKANDITSHDIYDTFSHAGAGSGDNTTLGIAESGQTWRKPSTGYSPKISAGRVNGMSFYNTALIDVEGTHVKLGATFTHDTTEGLFGGVKSDTVNDYVSIQAKANTIEIVQKISGKNNTLASYSKTLASGETYNMELEYDETNVKGYLNGEQILEVTAKEAITGKAIALFLVNTVATADDFYADMLS